MTATRTSHDRVREQLVRDGTPVSDVALATALRDQGVLVGDVSLLHLVDRVRSELVGLGPLEPLTRDPLVTDIVVNATEVYVDRGAGLERVHVDDLEDERAARRLAVRLATQAGRRLDDAMPFVDARLPGGIRLHAVLPPVSGGGTSICLRIPARRPFTMPDLVAAGTVPPTLLPWLQAIVDAHLTLLVSGGTGCGKTTILATLLGLCHPMERLVIVEDTAELSPDHPHVARLEGRPANAEGAGAITLRDLVRQALRMRPDRLIVGEVRGAEVVDLLAAFNTGHAGAAGTLHANSAADVPARTEALGLAAGMSRAAVHSQLSAGVDVVMHVTRDRTGGRRIDSVHVLRRAADGLVTTAAAILVVGDAALPGPALAGLQKLLQRN